MPPMKQHVLVVDDEPHICNYVSAYLKKNGFEVTTAETAADTVRLTDEIPFHVMVLDIALADEDGLELLGTIKAAHPNLPVIMMTGMGFDEELVNEALRKQASGYISKTLPLNQLLMEIRRALKQESGNSTIV
jgi:DNA-binding NtrC family response regulator